jgi:hypothetical protein
MALTSKQRKALPSSAFAYPKSRKYPVPTAAQAKKAGISAKQNLNLHRNARSRAAQKGTSGTSARIKAVSNKRTANIGKSGKTRHR